MNTILTLSNHHVYDIMHTNLGATSVAVQADELSEMQRLAREALPTFTKATTVKQVSNYSHLCIDPHSESIWTRFSQKLACELNRELAKHVTLSESIVFDDLYLTNYEESKQGVGPHRDTNCKNLVVVLVLCGNPKFLVYHDRHLHAPTEIPTRIGELMILRAKEFPVRGFDMGTPLHGVGEIRNGNMLQFGMRQYVSKPKLEQKG